MYSLHKSPESWASIIWLNISPEDQRVETEQHEVPLLPPEHEAACAIGVGQSGGLDKPGPGKMKMYKQFKNIPACQPVRLGYFLVTFEGLDVGEVW